jgi:hypothetical protein
MLILGAAFSASAQVTIGFVGDLATIEDACDINPSAASQVAAAETERLYLDILGRAPLPGEVEAWVTGFIDPALFRMIDIIYVSRAQTREMFMSAEYVARNRTDAEFISDCYTAFLRRPVSAGELNAWLSGTWSRGAAVTMIAMADEYLSYINALYCDPGLRGLPTENFVTQFFLGIEKRLPGEDELDEWVTAIEIDGLDPRQAGIDMANALLDTNKSLADQIRDLYLGFFGRFPEANEIDYWSSQVNFHGVTIPDLIVAMANVSEFDGVLNAFFP